MRKIINDHNDFVDEVVEGILAAHPRMLKAVSSDRRALARADAPIAGHVGIVTGGGSGHLPLFLGYVGQGPCTAVAVGNRAQGHPDPGAVAYLRFLEALQRSFDRMGS